MTGSVVLFSGGLDSTVLAYDAARGGDRLMLMNIDYGQRHLDRERAAAQDTADRLADLTRVKLVPVTLPVGELLPSALTSQHEDVPHGHYAAENMAATVVPNRNAIMLSIAYGAAVGGGYDRVLTAVHAGDHPIYPDCRPGFITAAEIAFRMGTTDRPSQRYVAVGAPFVEQDKAWIVAHGAKLGVPFADTWSCYEGGDRHCGRCGTCVERRHAFRDADVADPTEYDDLEFAWSV